MISDTGRLSFRYFGKNINEYFVRANNYIQKILKKTNKKCKIYERRAQQRKLLNFKELQAIFPRCGIY